MKHGTYVRGWKYDWDAARKEYDSLMAAGREIAASFCADPGVTMCPVCGEHHWNEFEVYLCSRCGAENDTNAKTAGPPKYMEKVRPRLYDGMRVQFVSHDIHDIHGKMKKRPGIWPAGNVPVGSVGTVRVDEEKGNELTRWRIDFNDLTPKEGYIFGVFGPFLDDDFIEATQLGKKTRREKAADAKASAERQLCRGQRPREDAIPIR